MSDQDKEMAQLKAFSNAQANTIIKLSKDLKIANDEIVHLKKLLEGSVPLIKPAESKIESGDNDQEYICKVEIAKLKGISLERELTLEECKKLDIYTKILKDIKHPSKDELSAKTMSDAELIRLVKDEE